MTRAILTAAQCRGARAIADLSIAKLARAAGVSVVLIRNFERGASRPAHTDLVAILAAFGQQGIRCSIDSDGVETVTVDWRNRTAVPVSA